MEDVFSDWLDLMLNSFLALTDNIQRHGLGVVEKLKTNTLDGIYNDRYMEIVKRYEDKREKGDRAIDHFTEATSLLIQETEELQRDVLGEIFMVRITYGEHGQFFTPDHITDMMASIVGLKPDEQERVLDPTCGSGRTLIAASKKNPNALFVGMDLDPRCAKVCAINMYLFDLNAIVLQGDTLRYEFSKEWQIRKGGFITEQDIVKQTKPKLAQGVLPLAA
jgi:type I restriction-modification system DNA methylase subunit